MELTNEQIERQDFVDNAIYRLIQELNPTELYIDWDIEIIGEIRDVVKNYFVELSICSDIEFYPELEN
jgi:hypothetical protein